MRIVCISMLLLSNTVGGEQAPLVTRRQRSSERSQCSRIREQITEALSIYAEALIEETAYWADMLQPDRICAGQTSHLRLNEWMQQRYSQLKGAAYFLRNGSLEYESHRISQKKILYISDILKEIACIQRAIMQSIRALVLGDATCCFINTHNKQVLQKHLETIRHLIADAYELTQQHPL